MALFDRFNRKSRITELVRAGLANGESTTVKQIRDCIYLLRNALGDTWQMASKEAAAGMKVADVIRKHGISEQTYYRWKSKYGGMEVSEARRLKRLEDENRRLKQMVADLSLDNQALKSALGKEW